MAAIEMAVGGFGVRAQDRYLQFRAVRAANAKVERQCQENVRGFALKASGEAPRSVKVRPQPDELEIRCPAHGSTRFPRLHVAFGKFKFFLASTFSAIFAILPFLTIRAISP
jgi:hypothetical protein